MALIQEIDDFDGFNNSSAGGDSIENIEVIEVTEDIGENEIILEQEDAREEPESTVNENMSRVISNSHISGS